MNREERNVLVAIGKALLVQNKVLSRIITGSTHRLDEQMSLLKELGHAEGGLEYELQRLGDPS